MKFPPDCHLEYFENFVSPKESTEIFDWIITHCPNLESYDRVMADGSTLHLDTGDWRFVDEELMDPALFFEYHGRRMLIPSVILPLRDRIERHFAREFSVCVCVYYRDGSKGVGFHSDPPAFGPTSLLPSISLGEKRRFLLRSQKTPSEQYEFELAHGSLFVMGEGCQENYEHSLPLSPESRNPRINLTFRPFTWPKGFQRKKRIG